MTILPAAIIVVNNDLEATIDTIRSIIGFEELMMDN